MPRALHYLGSLPPELSPDDDTAMSWFGQHTHGHELTALPAAQDPNWVVRYLQNLATAPPLELIHPGGYTSYDDLPGYRVRPGATLAAEHVAPATEQTTLAQLARFRQFRDQHPDLAATPLLVGVPHPIDLALFTFAGPTFTRAVPSPIHIRRALTHLPVFTRAVADYITRMEAHGGHITWQLETPSALIGMHKARHVPGGPGLAARVHARHTAALLARLPHRTSVILHLCYGNHRGRAVYTPDDLSWPVDYLNQLARWLHTRGRGVAQPPNKHRAHIPATVGEHPPPTDSHFYAPLWRLDPSWQVIAGVAAAADAHASQRALGEFELAADRQAWAVACGCGLGRVDEATAERAAKVMGCIA